MSLLGKDFDDAMKQVKRVAVRAEEVLFNLNAFIVKLSLIIPDRASQVKAK